MQFPFLMVIYGYIWLYIYIYGTIFLIMQCPITTNQKGCTHDRLELLGDYLEAHFTRFTCW